MSFSTLEEHLYRMNENIEKNIKEHKCFFGILPNLNYCDEKKRIYFVLNQENIKKGHPSKYELPDILSTGCINVDGNKYNVTIILEELLKGLKVKIEYNDPYGILVNHQKILRKIESLILNINESDENTIDESVMTNYDEYLLKNEIYFNDKELDDEESHEKESHDEELYDEEFDYDDKKK